MDGGYHGPFGQKSLLLRDRFVVTGGTGGGLLKISSWAVSSSDSALARPMTGLERG